MYVCEVLMLRGDIETANNRNMTPLRLLMDPDSIMSISSYHQQPMAWILQLI